MKKNEIQVGQNYIAKVSGKLAEVRITGESRHGGWDAVNVATKKTVRIKSVQRLRAAAGKPKAKVDPKAQAAADKENTRLDAERKASTDGMTASERAMAAASANRKNPLLTAHGPAFTDALNAATVEQLEEALKHSGMSNQQRNRIGIALKRRSEPAKAPADDVAKTVDAVTKGDLTKGVEIPTTSKKKATPRAAKPEGKMSGLDAAAKVLAEASEPLNAKQIVEAMAAKGYWSSTAATPHATIYAAMIVEIAKKGSDSRFRRVERGLFAATDAAKQSK